MKSNDKTYQICVVIPSDVLPMSKCEQPIHQDGLFTLDEAIEVINEFSAKVIHWVELKNGVLLSFSKQHQEIMYWKAVQIAEA